MTPRWTPAARWARSLQSEDSSVDEKRAMRKLRRKAPVLVALAVILLPRGLEMADACLFENTMRWKAAYGECAAFRFLFALPKRQIFTDKY